MSRYVTDTHALYWHIMGDTKLSIKAQIIFQGADEGNHQILIPGIILVEMVYLVEKARINSTTLKRVIDLLNDSNGSYCVALLNLETINSLQLIPREEIPDMPDRIIAATAHQLGIPLISRDGKIQKSKTVQVIW